MHSLEPEEEDYLFCPSFDWDGLYAEETFGDRLRLFYGQFNSSTRALLDDALFREIETNSIPIGLEILCKNQIIYKRLVQKHQKIGNEIRWIWPETVSQFSILVPTGSAKGSHSPEWCRQNFELPDYWLK
jgi:hypothetical protein